MDLYKLLKVKENATEQEIRDSYEKIMKKANLLPDSEKKIRVIKIAYEILINPEKRKKYDLEQASKKTEKLLENVSTKEEEQEKSDESKPSIDQARLQHLIDEQIDAIISKASENQKQNIEGLDEKKKLKAQKKQKRQEKRNARYKREKEIEAYGQYLQSQGYAVKYPWTLTRVKNTLIGFASIIIALVIIWHVPFVKKTLINLYDENFLVKAVVDLFLSIFIEIGNAIKGIFK